MTAASAALLALVLQLWAAVLLPASAASPPFEICTGDGIVHLPADGSGEPAPEHRHCGFCLLATGVALLPAAPTIHRPAGDTAAPPTVWVSSDAPSQRPDRPPVRGPPSA